MESCLILFYDTQLKTTGTMFIRGWLVEQFPVLSSRWAIVVNCSAKQMGILCAHARDEWNNLSSPPFVIFERAAVGF